MANRRREDHEAIQQMITRLTKAEYKIKQLEDASKVEIKIASKESVYEAVDYVWLREVVFKLIDQLGYKIGTRTMDFSVPLEKKGGNTI